MLFIILNKSLKIRQKKKKRRGLSSIHTNDNFIVNSILYIYRYAQSKHVLHGITLCHFIIVSLGKLYTHIIPGLMFAAFIRLFYEAENYSSKQPARI